jgi:hypothetical protein
VGLRILDRDPRPVSFPSEDLTGFVSLNFAAICVLRPPLCGGASIGEIRVCAPWVAGPIYLATQSFS